MANSLLLSRYPGCKHRKCNVTSLYLTLNTAAMKRILLFAVLATGLFSACSTAFKSGQTPDDLYYSPGGDDRATVREEKRSQQEQDEYQEYISSSDDRYLRMKVANRNRWNEIDNFSYWNDSRYDFMSYSYYNNFNRLNYMGGYDPFYSYNGFGINPYYGSLGYAGYGAFGGYGAYGYGGYGYGGYGYGSNYGWNNPYYTLISYNKPNFGGTTSATSGISAYKNKYYNNVNGAYSSYRTGGSASQNNFGTLVRRVFNGSSSNNTSSSFDRPARTFAPNNSNSSNVPAPSSSAGGNSGGFKSSGTTTSTGRGGKN